MKIFWDTNLFIYLWEAPGEFFEITNKLHSRMSSADIALVTSTLALAELQVGPRRAGDEALALRYRTSIKGSATVVPFDDEAADKFVFVRQKTTAKNADAIHLACAASHGVDLFITNDDKLWGLRIPGIQFVVSIQTALQLLP
jgi:predicted nucleic acid-binding protein